MTVSTINFGFDNTYARELEGFFAPWQGDVAPDPEFVMANAGLTAELGVDFAALNTAQGAAFLSGGVAPLGAQPLAQAYAGHQFGGFSPQLGDGRALLLGEVIDINGERRDIHLKGSGRTPFSRGGDGKAVLGPVLREYLFGEAMHALGIPTTRALAAITTGEDVMREGLKPGAVLARVASSHLRVGTFQFFAARQEPEKLRQLADYAIARHYPDLISRENKYLALLEHVRDQQMDLVAGWMAVGFVHGVMNTDNITISGETIDYGPCAFMDQYDANTVFSSIDKNGRYAYGQQPNIMQWNLARFAETLLHLINPDDTDTAVAQATKILNQASQKYQDFWLARMRAKLGLETTRDGDLDLVNALFDAMTGQGVDYTTLFRRLAEVAAGQVDAADGLFADPIKFIAWKRQWLERIGDDTHAPARMNKINPMYIPRNHLVDAALRAAEDDGDLSLFHRLSAVLATPFTEQEGAEDYAKPAPVDFGPFKTFCGT